MTDSVPPKKPAYGDLPSNSKKDIPKKKKLEKITTGEVVQRKKPLGKRIMESFTGDDSRTVGNYVFFDVVLPAIKQLISDALSTGVERLLFGEQSRGGARRGYTNYRGAYAAANRDMATNTGGRTAARPNPRAVHNFDDIVLDNRVAAEDVLEALAELIQNFDQATVADLYELVGITGSYTDDNWGWTSMAGARVERVKDGYLLRLPRTQDLV